MHGGQFVQSFLCSDISGGSLCHLGLVMWWLGRKISLEEMLTDAQIEMAWHQPQTNIVTIMQQSRVVLWTTNAICNVRN